ncbi:Hypothetical protein, putative [Bodo saltans]|uniref:Uncharacterized protein n=1 Tax=Bodo saltans TaxID=75058 RepID=A0A0S4IVJ8_BODSA|nr:Hypothetical protein, putative [Bodo saltans]|eukprot:CUG19761.1 Hypothetical protein, putative [Bodo saltans]
MEHALRHLFMGGESFARDDQVRVGWRITGPLYGVRAATSARRRELMQLCIDTVNRLNGKQLRLLPPSQYFDAQYPRSSAHVSAATPPLLHSEGVLMGGIGGASFDGGQSGAEELTPTSLNPLGDPPCPIAKWCVMANHSTMMPMVTTNDDYGERKQSVVVAMNDATTTDHHDEVKHDDQTTALTADKIATLTTPTAAAKQTTTVVVEAALPIPSPFNQHITSRDDDGKQIRVVHRSHSSNNDLLTVCKLLGLNCTVQLSVAQNQSLEEEEHHRDIPMDVFTLSGDQHQQGYGGASRASRCALAEDLILSHHDVGPLAVHLRMDALKSRAFRIPANAKKLRRTDEDISSLQKIIDAISCELLLKGETVEVVDISRQVHAREFIIGIVVKGVKGRVVALRAEFIRHHIQESLSTVAVLDASIEDSLVDRDGDSATTANKSSALIFGEGVTSAAFSVLAEMRDVFVALRTLHDDDHKVSSAIVVGQPEAVKDLCFDLGTIPKID